MGLFLRLLFLLVLIAVAVPTWLHVNRGAALDAAFQATMVDAQVVPTCPERLGDAWRFMNRGEVTLPVDQARDAYCAQGAYAASTPSPVAALATATPPSPGGTLTTPATPGTGFLPPTHPTPFVATPTSAVPEARLQIWRTYMLQLINKDRQENGLQPITLGSNPAAQLHAEDLFAHKYLSHWGRNGLKPYMRYTLAGGTGYAAENVSGEPCPRDPDANYRRTPTFEELEQDQAGLMNSPGHRVNILNPWHKKVNLGIACDDVGCAVVQLFEAEYVAWTAAPVLDNGGVLRMAGDLRDGFELAAVQVWYDQPPHELTFGQVGRTYSYGVGQKPAAFLREPPGFGFRYSEDTARYSWTHGVDPYGVDPNVDRPQRIQQGGVIACSTWPRQEFEETAMVPLITATTWKKDGPSFSVQADISRALEANGPGVYTVALWGRKDGKDLSLTNYALFVQ